MQKDIPLAKEIAELMPPFKKDVHEVKELGDRIGFGHLMELASAIWRYELKAKGLPENGAFVPTIVNGYLDPTEAVKLSNESMRYDIYVSLALKDE